MMDVAFQNERMNYNLNSSESENLSQLDLQKMLESNHIRIQIWTPSHSYKQELEDFVTARATLALQALY